jgi:hypothetical protein
MTDVELLAALAAGNFELILEGSTFLPGINGPALTPQTTFNTGQGTRENVRKLEQGPQPQGPPALQQPGLASHHPTCTKQNQASPLAQQQQASPLDQQRWPAGQGKANRGQQDGDSQAQPGYYSQ